MTSELRIIIENVAKVYEVSESDIVSSSRKDEFVKARAAYCTIAKEVLNAKMYSIGNGINVTSPAVANLLLYHKKQKHRYYIGLYEQSRKITIKQLFNSD